MTKTALQLQRAQKTLDDARAEYRRCAALLDSCLLEREMWQKVDELLQLIPSLYPYARTPETIAFVMEEAQQFARGGGRLRGLR